MAEVGVGCVSSGRMRTRNPRCPLLCWTGRQQFRHFLGRIDAAGHGAVHDGRPQVVACQEEVPGVLAELTAHLHHRREPAGLAHAHGFAPAVNAGEQPLVVTGQRGAGRGIPAGVAKELALDLLVVKSGSLLRRSRSLSSFPHPPPAQVPIAQPVNASGSSRAGPRRRVGVTNPSGGGNSPSGDVEARRRGQGPGVEARRIPDEDVHKVIG